MSAPKKPPRRYGVPNLLREFFEANPDEELTYEDIQAKFGCTYRAAWNAVLKSPDVIESVHVIRNRSKGIAS